ncbi:uncharacterized protein TNCV_4202781 [Trichonephila clavipes]|uniref:Uncharacterized protein n=1 Tax=Trichonephila clavipes TaxID=2585209 RepID=A0A8X6S3V8_TRICX|nr:uncharacterized protein TNCV_4202781 [Trichonephila clavipes]
MISQFGENSLRNSCLAFIQLSFNFLQRVRSLVGRSSAYYARVNLAIAKANPKAKYAALPFRNSAVIYTDRQEKQFQPQQSRLSDSTKIYGKWESSTECKIIHANKGQDWRLDNIFFLHGLAVVAEESRYQIVAGLVTNSSPIPLKTRRVGQRCTINLSRAETSSRWCGVVVRRGGASSGVIHVT